jgi:N-acetylglutamate synthase-like GNAT family acetyltransferase
MVVYATQDDMPEIKTFDKHISEKMLIKAIMDKRVLVFKSADIIMGIARWSYFWDSIPFLNMLYVPDGYTHHGVGSELLKFWENEMQKQGYTRVFTSSMAKESGQQFFRKFGYRDIGNLYDEGEGLELIFEKRFE